MFGLVVIAVIVAALFVPTSRLVERCILWRSHRRAVPLETLVNQAILGNVASAEQLERYDPIRVGELLHRHLEMQREDATTLPLLNTTCELIKRAARTEAAVTGQIPII